MVLPLLPILPRATPTTGITLPTVRPILITPSLSFEISPDESESLPTTSRNSMRGVKIIDHSIAPFNELSRSASDDSIEDEILITPETQSPLTPTILLRHGHEGDHLKEDSFQNITSKSDNGQASHPSPSISPGEEQDDYDIPCDAFLEVQIPRSAHQISINPHAHGHHQLQSQPQCQSQSRLSRRHAGRMYRPSTSFGKGDVIYLQFNESEDSSSSSDKNDLESNFQNNDDNESVSLSESSGYSSNMPPDQKLSKICMYDYWNMVDRRLLAEREERLKKRRFHVPVDKAEEEAEDDEERDHLSLDLAEEPNNQIKVKDWLKITQVSRSPGPWSSFPHSEFYFHFYSSLNRKIEIGYELYN
ncbi:uncharacterized protein I303_105592 [Kwoniella dejecticola CBS 10117]|uniref:Uncharacterized protein n=1 Tax=Kwoniella dejecticola CBS 10117 TaxID=1296121 RepID=A0A1A6A222_9TREE|nr:uncharacterized protein I303_04965 [Kwoniella dejecticola CBS 10117]OBR84108.1 hypothetical protein I303_04965 [Kwoniella dejecticola CBS 10117]